MIVGEYYGLDLVKGDLGIEVEVESKRPLPLTVKGWTAKVDGSLRANYAIEYVSSPIFLDQAIESIKLLNKSIAGHTPSVRTGVHVHVNCQHLTLKELHTYMTAYYMLENVLVAWASRDREGNLFTLRIKDAVDFATMKSMLDRKNPPEDYVNSLKYSSMNTCCIRTFGTLEFRSFPTEKSLFRIIPWMEVLLTLREKAKEFKTPQALLEFFSIEGAEAFVQEFIPNEIVQNSVLKMEDFRDSIFEGVMNAQDFILEVL